VRTIYTEFLTERGVYWPVTIRSSITFASLDESGAVPADTCALEVNVRINVQYNRQYSLLIIFILYAE
jgi:hypothetical protein